MRSIGISNSPWSSNSVIAEPFSIGVEAAERFIEFKDALGGS